MVRSLGRVQSQLKIDDGTSGGREDVVDDMDEDDEGGEWGE